MPSLRSQIINALIRNRHLFRFQLRPEVVDESFSVQEFRAGIRKKAPVKGTPPKDISIERIKIKGRPAKWIIPDNAPEGKVLMYIHGGGFISGDCESHEMHVIKFARESGISTLLFDYRLAPEHPFPAALEDCIATYRWLLDQDLAPDNIVIGGESAGGTLTLTTLVALKDKGLPMPAAAFSISPVTDLTCKAASFTYNARKDIAPMNSWHVWTQYYIGNSNPALPHISPLNADLTGLPPLFVCVGTYEIHLDDAKAIAAKAQDSGVDVTLRTWEGMVHAFPILSPLFPEAKQALGEICAFARQAVAE